MILPYKLQWLHWYTYWGGDGALSTTQVRDMVDPRTKWNSSDEPGLSIWAFGLTTVSWKTKEWGPFAEDIWKSMDDNQDSFGTDSNKSDQNK